VEVVASLSQGRTTAAQCDLFTYKSVPVIFEPPYTFVQPDCSKQRSENRDILLAPFRNPSHLMRR